LSRGMASRKKNSVNLMKANRRYILYSAGNGDFSAAGYRSIDGPATYPSGLEILLV